MTPAYSKQSRQVLLLDQIPTSIARCTACAYVASAINAHAPKEISKTQLTQSLAAST